MKNKQKMTWSVLKEGRNPPLPTNKEIIDYMEQSKDPEFNNFTTEELFYHLIDLHQIPYEEEFENWKQYKAQMVYMCEEGYKHGKL